MPTVEKISNWDGLASFLLSLPVVDIAFRGQGKRYPDSGEHIMKARIDRCLEGVHPDKRLRTERAVCQRFREHAPIYLSTLENRYLDSRWLQLVVMQHYGAPTRLLDWTKSAWIAAYFAVSSDWDSDGYMYGFRRDRLDQEVGKRIRSENDQLVWGLGLPGDHFTDPSRDLAKENEKLFNENEILKLSEWVAPYYSRTAHFPRLVAQQGLFTFGSKPDLNHWKHICGLLENNECWIVRIKSKKKPHILRGLNLMGLNGATLFPGADGIGRGLEGFARAWHIKPTPDSF